MVKFKEMIINLFDFLSATWWFCIRVNTSNLYVRNKVCLCLQMGPGNESCKDVLLNSDRLMLIDLLHNSMKDIWIQSNCNSKNPVFADIQALYNRIGPIGWPSNFVLKFSFLPGRFRKVKNSKQHFL